MPNPEVAPAQTYETATYHQPSKENLPYPLDLRYPLAFFARNTRRLSFARLDLLRRSNQKFTRRKSPNQKTPLPHPSTRTTKPKPTNQPKTQPKQRRHNPDSSPRSATGSHGQKRPDQALTRTGRPNFSSPPPKFKLLGPTEPSQMDHILSSPKSRTVSDLTAMIVDA